MPRNAPMTKAEIAALNRKNIEIGAKFEGGWRFAVSLSETEVSNI